MFFLLPRQYIFNISSCFWDLDLHIAGNLHTHWVVVTPVSPLAMVNYVRTTKKKVNLYVQTFGFWSETVHLNLHVMET